MSTPADLILDNPLIVKHKRSRLRTAQIIPGLIAIVLVCGVLTYVSFTMGNASTSQGFFTFLTVIGGLIVVIGGGNQVAMSVGSAKESGILDFHRVSPLPAEAVTLGFFLGAPIREYLLFAVILPFMLITAVQGGVGFETIVNMIVPIFLTAWLIHAIAIFTALVAKKPKMASAAVVGLTIMTLWVGSAAVGAFQQMAAANGANGDLRFLDFFGFAIPRLLFLAIYEGAAITFFLVAATRKMRADRAMTFAKWEALLCMATVVALTLGAFWTAKGISLIVPALLYVFVIAGIVLASTVTPNLGDYVKGVRRARRTSHRRAPALADYASNLWTVFGLAAWVAVGATIAWEAIAMVPGNNNVLGPAMNQLGRLAFSQTIAVGVFTVAYYGLGKQYFALKFSRRSDAYFRLFLFLVWVMPLLIAVAASAAGAPTGPIQMLMGVCPWAGIILSIEGGPAANDVAYWVRFMALFPSIALALLFLSLLLNQQRKIDGGLVNSPMRLADKEPLML